MNMAKGFFKIPAFIKNFILPRGTFYIAVEKRKKPLKKWV